MNSTPVTLERLREIERLQKSWCSGSSAAIQDNAAMAAESCMIKVMGHNLPLGPIVEVGPQHGFGLARLQQWSQNACGLEAVQEFTESCHQKGLRCMHGWLELIDTDPAFDGKFNWYLRDTAEHLFDRERAFRNMLDRLDSWIYLSVPIEPEEAKDKAHLGQFRSREEVDLLLRELDPVWQEYREPDVKPGRLTGIWKKPSSD